MNRPAPMKFFSSVSCKILTGLELYDISTLDFYLFTCLRIPTFTGLTTDLPKCTILFES
jgi:hypothetical protein